MKLFGVSMLYLAAGGLVALSGRADEASEEDEPYVEPSLTAEDRGHWAYQPVRRDIAGDIDSLVLAKLRELGISDFSPRAEAATVLRRLHFHLTGLPPTEEEVAEFSIEHIGEVIRKKTVQWPPSCVGEMADRSGESATSQGDRQSRLAVSLRARPGGDGERLWCARRSPESSAVARLAGGGFHEKWLEPEAPASASPDVACLATGFAERGGR